MRRTRKKTHRKKRGALGPKKQSSLRPPSTGRQYFRLTPKHQETWDSIGHVITRIRDRVPLSKAAKEFGIAPDVVVALGRPALRKRNGRYVATRNDHLLRMVNTLTVKGKEVHATRDSRQASLVGGHWAAVQRYLQTGDDSALLKFKGVKVTDASGKRHGFLTNIEELNRLASAGVLSFESMYAGGQR